MTALRR